MTNKRIEENQNGISPLPFLPNSPAVHISDLDPITAKAIQGTQSISSRHLTPDTPSSTDRSLAGRVTLGKPASLQELEESQQKLAEDLESKIETLQTEPKPHSLDFPNLAWESVKIGLEKERMTNNQLNAHIKEAEKHQKDIDLLLDFSAELTSHKENTEMSEKMKGILTELKTRGIDLWKSEEKTLSKEKLSELKSLSSSQVDKLRSNLQILFTTKIQTLVQSIGAIMETLKDIIRNNTKLISTANRLPGH